MQLHRQQRCSPEQLTLKQLVRLLALVLTVLRTLLLTLLLLLLLLLLQTLLLLLLMANLGSCRSTRAGPSHRLCSPRRRPPLALDTRPAQSPARCGPGTSRR